MHPINTPQKDTVQLHPSKYPPTIDGNQYLAILKPVYSTILTSNNLCKKEYVFYPISSLPQIPLAISTKSIKIPPLRLLIRIPIAPLLLRRSLQLSINSQLLLLGQIPPQFPFICCLRRFCCPFLYIPSAFFLSLSLSLLRKGEVRAERSGTHFSGLGSSSPRVLSSRVVVEPGRYLRRDGCAWVFGGSG